jgi:hypothetical protein
LFPAAAAAAARIPVRQQQAILVRMAQAAVVVAVPILEVREAHHTAEQEVPTALVRPQAYLLIRALVLRLQAAAAARLQAEREHSSLLPTVARMQAAAAAASEEGAQAIQVPRAGAALADRPQALQEEWRLSAASAAAAAADTAAAAVVIVLAQAAEEQAILLRAIQA